MRDRRAMADSWAFLFLAFFGLLDRAIERRRKLGEAGRENAIDRRALARFVGGSLLCVPETKMKAYRGTGFGAFANAKKPLNCGMEAL